MVVNTGRSKPAVARDVQDSHVLKEADVGANGVLHGATLQHVVAPLQTVFLACFVIVFQVVATDVAVRVFHEGFLSVALCAFWGKINNLLLHVVLNIGFVM